MTTLDLLMETWIVPIALFIFSGISIWFISYQLEYGLIIRLFEFFSALPIALYFLMKHMVAQVVKIATWRHDRLFKFLIYEILVFGIVSIFTTLVSIAHPANSVLMYSEVGLFNLAFLLLAIAPTLPIIFLKEPIDF